MSFRSYVNVKRRIVVNGISDLTLTTFERPYTTEYAYDKREVGNMLRRPEVVF